MAEKPTGYKYVVPQGSILYTEVLSPYVYNKLVLLYPLWLHPNVITLLGFLSATATIAIFAHSSPNFAGECSQTEYMIVAALFLAYIIFDNTDGKQARRTKTSSNAGEVFDHGVDMTVSTISMLMSADAMKIGPQMAFTIILAGQVATYMNNWYHKITGVMSWGGRYLSVDEATLFTFMIVSTAGLYGPAIFDKQLIQVDALGEYRNITLANVVSASGVVTTSLDGVGKVFTTLSIAREMGKTVEAVTSLLPLLIYLAFYYINASGCLATSEPLTYMMGAGLVFSIMGTRLIFSMKFSGSQLLEQNIVNVFGFVAFAALGPYSPFDTSTQCGVEEVSNAKLVVIVLLVVHFLAFVRGLTIVSAGQSLFTMEKKSD